MEKSLPQLYYIKVKISHDLGFIAIGVAMTTKRLHYIFYLSSRKKSQTFGQSKFLTKKNEVENNIFRQIEEMIASLESHVSFAKEKLSRAAERMIATVHELERGGNNRP